MTHRLLTLDFETYFDKEYSLRCMPTPNYILDQRFETILVAVKEGQQPSQIVDGPDFPSYLAQFDPARTTTVTFNALFDNSILAWQYGFVPARMLDAMGMARALRGHLLASASLKSVLEFLKLGKKGDTLMKVQGMHRADIKQAGLWPDFCEYALGDVDGAANIFDHLLPEFPSSERRLMDMVLRCAVEPRFLMDTDMLTQHLAEVRADKAALLSQCGVGVDQLMSTEQFKDALEKLGVTVEYKTSPTGRKVPAFAKTDEFMATLAEHPDTQVQALAAARLGHKSTIEETRSEKLLSIASLPWAHYRDGNPRLWSGGTMPVPLGYGKAHTHRLAGEWGMNMQNLPTARGGKKTKLRKALVAPPGWKVIVADLGQIEARLDAWICREKALLEQFANNQDPYMIMGASIFGCAIDKVAHPIERFIGKTAILGLGYGCGAAKFFDMVNKLARALKMDLKGMWDENRAQQAVDTYRAKYRNIAQSWRALDDILRDHWAKHGGSRAFGPCLIGHGYVELPNGLKMRYGNPRLDDSGQELWYTYGRYNHKIYGAKMLENIVQALARIVVMNAALRIEGHGTTLPVNYYRFVLQAHDELVFIVPDAEVDKAKAIVHSEMTRRPSWAQDVPLTADVGVGQSYGEAK